MPMGRLESQWIRRDDSTAFNLTTDYLKAFLNVAGNSVSSTELGIGRADQWWNTGGLDSGLLR